MPRGRLLDIHAISDSDQWNWKVPHFFLARAQGQRPRLQPYYGVCAVGGAGDTATESVQTASTAREDFWTTRVDHKISDKDSLFGTYLFDDAVTHSPDPLNTWVVGNLSRRQAVILEENHIFSPILVNTVRGGFSRVSAIVNSTISAINPASKDNTLGIYSDEPAIRAPDQCGWHPGIWWWIGLRSDLPLSLELIPTLR